MESFKDKLNNKAERLKFLRYLTGLKRTEMEEKYKIPQVTLKKWENSVLPITRKGIERCLSAYEKESVYTTVEWVEEGIGPIPSLSVRIKDNCDLDDDLLYFKTKYPDCIVHKIERDNLYPKYRKGEIVIGNIHQGPIMAVDKTDCIFELVDKSRGITRVFIEDKKINFLSTNYDFNQDKALLINVKVEFLAPIKWHQINKV